MNKKPNIKIDDLKKQDNFRAPDHYFDSLAQDIQDKLTEQTKTPNRIKKIWLPASVTIAAAAAIIGLTRCVLPPLP